MKKVSKLLVMMMNLRSITKYECRRVALTLVYLTHTELNDLSRMEEN